mmetsp:Transcript_116836/g.342132  ORF Transcript_116836/g.342132 Transcript_116836/m.342132 type:complete len:317 (+) Transcript_116836:67-1017(+)
MGIALSASEVPGAAIHERALHFSSEADGILVRPITEADLPAAAALCHKAFNSFNASVGHEAEFPPREIVDVPMELLRQSFTEGFSGFVAVKDGEVVGSNVLGFQDEVASIGPISSSVPGAGHLLMQAVMKAAAVAGQQTVRLHQVGSNTRSFSLYLDLGFDPLVTCGSYCGFAAGPAPAGYIGASLTKEDVEACSALHSRVCGVHRRNEIRSSIGGPHPNCVIRDSAGRLVAYSTGCYLSGHSVACSVDAFKFLVIHQSKAVSAAQAAGAPLPPVTLFVPHTYPELLRWLKNQGLRLMRQVVQMGYGPRTEPSNGF